MRDFDQRPIRMMSSHTPAKFIQLQTSSHVPRILTPDRHLYRLYKCHLTFASLAVLFSFSNPPTQLFLSRTICTTFLFLIELFPRWLPHAIGSLFAMSPGEMKNTEIWTWNLVARGHERVFGTRLRLQ